ncbi:MAG: four helix bundle protein [bacterium]
MMKNGGIDIYTRANAFSCLLLREIRSVNRDAMNQNMLAQAIRSGTSLGANLAEADGAPTRKDFVNKLSIAIKEGKETLYWLSLLKDAKCLGVEQYNELSGECEQLVKILVVIRRKSQESAPSI